MVEETELSWCLGHAELVSVSRIRSFCNLENTVSFKNGKGEGGGVFEFVNVVWPRAMNFLDQLKERIFFFTVSGSETTTKFSIYLL